MEKFQVSLRLALEGKLDLDKELKRHEDQMKPGLSLKKKIPPIVLVDNRISHSKTVVEVQAMDRLGLLFHISKALAALNLNISAAKISTERALAYDVFYVSDGHGQKITEEAARAMIVQTLQRELEIA